MLVSAPIDDGGGDHLFLHDIPGPLDRTIGVNSNFMQVFIIVNKVYLVLIMFKYLCNG